MAQGAVLPPGVKLHPLRWPGSALANESLLGLVTRRGSEHFLGSNRIILKSCGIDLRHQGDATVYATQQDMQELSRILRIDEGEIRKRACIPVGEDHSGRLVEWGGRSMRLRDLELRYRRISPQSLRQSDHHRQSWLLRLLPYCPESFEELTDSCPKCEGKLRWSLARPIARCDRDDCVLANDAIPAAESHLPKQMRSSYAFFAALLSADEGEAEDARSKLHCDIQNIDTPTLADLIYLLADIDRPSGEKANMSTGRDENSVEIARRITKGTEALAGWPGSLERLAARAINNRKSERHLWSRLKLAAKSHPNPKVRELVISGAPVIAEGLRRAVAPNSSPIMLQSELVRTTGISTEQGAFLSKGDYMRPSGVIGDAGSSKLDRALCEEFIAQREASKRNEAVAARLMLPTYAIIQMQALGILERPTNSGLNALEPETWILNASVDRLVAELASLDQVADGTEGTLSLRAASRIIGGGLKPWASIMNAILRRQLPCFRAKDDQAPTTRSLLVRRKDLGILAEMTTVSDGGIDQPGIASQQDTMEILNATFDQVAALGKQGEVTFEQAHRKLACSMSEVLAIAALRIFSAEVSLRTGIAPSKLKEWCGSKGLVEQFEGAFSRSQFDSKILARHVRETRR